MNDNLGNFSKSKNGISDPKANQEEDLNIDKEQFKKTNSNISNYGMEKNRVTTKGAKFWIIFIGALFSIIFLIGIFYMNFYLGMLDLIFLYIIPIYISAQIIVYGLILCGFKLSNLLFKKDYSLNLSIFLKDVIKLVFFKVIICLIFAILVWGYMSCYSIGLLDSGFISVFTNFELLIVLTCIFALLLIISFFSLFFLLIAFNINKKFKKAKDIMLIIDSVLIIFFNISIVFLVFSGIASTV